MSGAIILASSARPPDHQAGQNTLRSRRWEWKRIPFGRWPLPREAGNIILKTFRNVPCGTWTVIMARCWALRSAIRLAPHWSSRPRGHSHRSIHKKTGDEWSSPSPPSNTHLCSPISPSLPTCWHHRHHRHLSVGTGAALSVVSAAIPVLRLMPPPFAIR